MYRKDQYKHKADSIEELKGKRRNQEISLRKDKRDKLIQAKRFRHSDDLDEDAGHSFTTEQVTSLTKQLQHGSTNKLNDLQTLRQACSKGPAYIEAFFKSNMPNLKQTPRMDPLCFHCKTQIRADEYSEHTKTCWGQRFSCKSCDKTFKEAPYLKRHMQKFHEDQDQKNLESVSKATQETSSTDTQDYGQDKQEPYDQEWDKDPQIDLVSESGAVDDFLEGRTFRKPISPAPVKPSAPKRTKIVEPKVVEADTKDPDNNKIKLSFSSKAAEGSKVTQKFTVRQNDETVMETVVARTEGSRLGNFEFGLQELVPNIKSIKPEDVVFRCVDGNLQVEIRHM